MSGRINKVVNLSFHGGLIGALITNQRAAFERQLNQHNADGWSFVQAERTGTANLLVYLLQLALLVVTLGLYTFGLGYLLFFEKDR